MTFNLFVYRREKSKEYVSPFMSPYDGDSIVAGLKQTGCPAHLKELSLYKIGTIDNLTGVLSCDDKPEFICDFAFYEKEVEDAEATEAGSDLRQE